MVKVESEKELEKFLVHILAEVPNMRVERQVKLGPYGRADILAWTVLNVDGTKTLLGHVVEIKKEEAGFKAMNQLCRYMKAVEIAFIDVKNGSQSLVDDVLVLGSVFCKNIIDIDELGYILAQMQNIYFYKYLISMKSGIKAKGWPGWLRGITDPYPKETIIIKKDLLKAIEKSTENANRNTNYYNPFLNICV